MEIMNKEINVLSCFDGMSCAQLALRKSGVKVDKYFASELDKHAIKVTMANFPDTIQLGDVTKVDVSSLPVIDLLIGGSPCQSFSFAGKRQGMAAKGNIEILTLEHYLQLKSENYEFEGASYLFWEYMRILTELRKVNPDIKFLLENVEMGKKWEGVLNKAIGVQGIHINSALLSAQNRKRIYWTNICIEPDGMLGDMKCGIKQPKDKGILLRDILEKEVDEKYFLSDKALKFVTNGMRLKKKYTQNAMENDKALPHLAGNQTNWCGDFVATGCLKFGRTDEAKEIRKQNMANGKDTTPFADKEITGVDYDKMNTLTTVGSKDNLLIVASRGRQSEDGMFTEQQLEPRFDGKTNCLTSVQKDSYVVFAEGYEQDNRAYFEDGKSGTLDVKSGRQKVIQRARGFNAGFEKELDKSPTLSSNSWEHNNFVTESAPINIFDDYNGNFRTDEKTGTLTQNVGNAAERNGQKLFLGSRIRRLTPIECCRLQTVPDDYFFKDGKQIVSDSQIYKMLGNGFTVDVISYILSHLPKDYF
jgi:DNA (cytosine-5)-methyltransferase 1